MFKQVYHDLCCENGMLCNDFTNNLEINQMKEEDNHDK